MAGYIYDTTVLSALLDAAHQRHADIARAVAVLPENASQFVSAISLDGARQGRRCARRSVLSYSPPFGIDEWPPFVLRVEANSMMLEKSEIPASAGMTVL